MTLGLSTLSSAPLQMRFAHGTLAGIRSSGNDDAVLVAPLSTAQRGDVLLCAVADGVGSMPLGAEAARIAVRALASSLADNIRRGAGLTQALQQAVLHADDAVRRSTKGQGATTLVVAVLNDSDITIANVGDSRAYLYDQGRLHQVTRDHAWAAEQVRSGQLTHEEASAHPWRTVITRCLGGDAPPEVDLFEAVLRPGRHLLLCSDGLTGVAGEEEIGEVVASRNPDSAVDDLLELARSRGARDDVTLCIVSPAPQHDPIPGPRPDNSGTQPLPQTEPVRLEHRSALSRRPHLGVAVAVAAILTAVALVVADGLTWLLAPDRITPGVRVAGAAVGGQSAQEAQASLDRAVTPVLACPVTVHAGNATWVRTAAELGLRHDTAATASGALQVGRGGSWTDQALVRLRTAVYGADVPPVVRVDAVTVLLQVGRLAVEYERGDGLITGERIPVQQAALRVAERLADLSCAPVTLPVAPVNGAPGQTGRD